MSTGGRKRSGLRTVFFSIFMLLAALSCNAVMDTLQFHYKGSVFASQGFAEQWWNPEVSWQNKWQGGDPDIGERFPLSSSVLVFLTSGWHLFKALAVFFVGLAVLAPFTKLFYLPWYGWVAGILLLGGIFWVFFEGLVRML